MSWQDVNDILRFWEPGDPGSNAQELLPIYGLQGAPLTDWDFLAEEDVMIRQILFDLYHSPFDTGRDLLEQAVVNADAAEQQNPDGGFNRALWLFRTSGDTSSRDGTNSAAINFDDVGKLYIGKDGYVKQFSLERLLIHELIHGIEELHDLVKSDGTPYGDVEPVSYNDADFNHLGKTVEKTNQIMIEMGLETEGDGRAGYDAHPEINGDFGEAKDTIIQGIDYAFSMVDFAYVDSFRNITPDNLDTSMRPDLSSDLLFGLEGHDHIRSGAGVDYLYGGSGNDFLYGGSGLDLLHGGVQGGSQTLSIVADGEDTADYSEGDMRNPTDHGITVHFDLSGAGAPLDGKKPVRVSDDGYGDTDYLHSIEKIIGTSFGDTVTVNGGEEVFVESNYALSTGKLEIDGGTGDDTLDFLAFTGPIDTEHVNGDVTIGDVTFTNFEIIKDSNSAGKIGEGASREAEEKRAEAYTYVDGVEEIYGNQGNDYLVIGTDGVRVDGGEGSDFLIAINPSSVNIDGGAGDDIIYSIDGQGAVIHGGAGNDTIFSSTPGAVVHGGANADTFILSNNTQIADAKPEDRIVLPDGTVLTGGVRWAGSEKEWAYGQNHIRYGLNDDGELVIEHELFSSRYGWGATYVANAEVSPFVSQSERTAGILALEIEVSAQDGWEGWSQGLQDFFKTFFGFYLKAMTGESYYEGVDPLVLDLDGDGLELTAQTSQSPLFDLDGDGFAEPTGWVHSDDGLLAHDINGNGQIDDITELFGSPTASGFDELAAHDVNQDGVIDASDTIFSDLRVWRDLNQNGQADSGELFTLADVNIESLSLTATPSNVDNSTNLVAETGSFTFTDGTTSELADVKFRIDNYETEWLGDASVDPAVEHLANLKGHGTLADLHVSMSRDATGTLRSTLESVLPTLNTPNLATLRELALPILEAWADVDLGATSPPASVKPDVHAFVDRTGQGTDIVDFAVQDLSGNWGLASGTTVLDAQGVAIPQPTLADILAFMPAAAGAWETIEGRHITFLERHMGEEIAIERVEAGDQGAIAALEGIVEFMIGRMDVLAVRLAMQGGLQSYFVDMEYNLDRDGIQATSVRGLAPMFEAVFTAAPGTAAGDTAWLAGWEEILNVVSENFARYGGEHLRPSYSFLFTNIVTAFENVGLAIDIKSAAILLGIPEEMLSIGDGEVVGDSGHNIFYLSGGDQTLKGEKGYDVYVVGRDFGNDVIDDHEAPLTGQSQDVLRFAHYSPGDLEFTREGIDLVITVPNTTNELRILEHFIGHKPDLFGNNLNPDRGVNEIIFADGTVWRAFDIAEAVSRPLPTNQTITGTWETDFMDGGAGDDVLSGGDGGDIYFFGYGYGNDIAHDQLTYVLLDDPDFLAFGQGITTDNISLSRDGNSSDILITLDDTGDTLLLQGFAAATYTGSFGKQWFHLIENLVFEDGTFMQWYEVLERVVAEQKTDGDDTIYGFSYEDVLDGGAGNDYLSGGNENDTYIFDAGYGHDIIDENLDNILSGATDTIKFGTGVDLSQVTFERDGNSGTLVVRASANDTLSVQSQFNATYTGVFGTRWFDRIEQFQFQVDGQTVTLSADDLMDRVLQNNSTAGDDTIYGFDRADVLDGDEGDDYLSGGNENDTYIFDIGYGHDTIEDNQGNILSGSTDTLDFGVGVDLDQVAFDRDGNSGDLIVRVSANDTVTARGQFNVTYTGVAGVRWFDRIELFEFEVAGETVTLSTDEVMARVLLDKSTDGDDTIYGFAREDVLDGGMGDDYLSGGDEDDTYIFGLGYGQDTIEERRTSIFSGDYDKVIFAGALTPDDITLSRDGNASSGQVHLADGSSLTLSYIFTGGLNFNSIEEYYFEGSDTSLFLNDIQLRLLAESKTSGDDSIYGFYGDDLLDGGAGNDYLSGSDGNDTYIFGLGYGQDTILDARTSIFSGDADKVIFTGTLTPDDITLSRQGTSNTVTATLSDGSSLTVQGMFTGGINFHSVEEFHFEGSGTSLFVNDIKQQLLADSKTSGDDVIYGFSGSDRLDGGAGNDRLEGSSGNDTYVFDRGYGHDVMYDGFVSILWANNDTIEFGGTLTPDDLWVSRDGTKLVFEIKDTSDTLTVEAQYHYTGWYSIENFAFSDGQVLTRAQIDLLTLLGSDEDNTVTGTGGADLIDGGGGDDTLVGLGGSDTYVYDAGDGHDVIDEGQDESSIDLISLGAGLVPADLTLERIGTLGNDVRIHIQGTQGSIYVKNQLAGLGQGVEQIVFNDGTIWTGDDFPAHLLTDATTDGDDTIAGFDNRQDTIYGGAGNDVLDGLSGDDSLYGGDDHDQLIGGAGDDWLYGEGGDDVLIGNSGTDFFDGGTGIDTVDFSSSTDSLIVDLAQEQVSASGTIETLLGIENVIGGTGDDRFIGSSAANVLSGMSGSDAYVFGASGGNDVIREDGDNADIDIVELLQLTPADVSFKRSGPGEQDLLITVIATGETLTVEQHFLGQEHGVESIQFSDGSSWDRDDIVNTVSILGTDGDDTLVGTAGNDTFNAMLGNDVLQGVGGSDTYLFGVGYGSDQIIEAGVVTDLDKVELVNLLPADVQLGRIGDDLHIQILASVDTLRITNHFQNEEVGIEQIIFSNGEVWDRALIQMNAVYLGTGGPDTIQGTDGDNVFLSSADDDTIDGKGGNDIYYYSSGDGNDQFSDTGSVVSDIDRLEFTDLQRSDLVFTRTLTDLLVTVTSTQAVIRVPGQFTSDLTGVEEIAFADGELWTLQDIQSNVREYVGGVNGTAAGEILVGTNGANIIVGQEGNDTLYGNDGSDTYIFYQGDGQDRIEDNGWYDTDKLLIHGYTPEEVSVARVGTSITAVLTFAGTTDQITLTNEFTDRGDMIEEIIFDDGTVWTNGYLRGRVVAEAATDGDDTIFGFIWDDGLIAGGLGNDTLHGWDGSDTYVFNRGDGQDRIDDNGWYDNDRLLIHGYTPEEVSVARVGLSNTAVLTFAGTTDQITLTNEFTDQVDLIEQIIFDDGTIWTEGSLRARVMAEAATDGDDIIIGFVWGETLAGGLGNDTLHGGEASDTYVFNRGDGQDRIDDNGWYDNDRLLIHSYTTDEVYLGREGTSNTIVLTFAGTTDQVTLVNGINDNVDKIEQVVFDDGTIWTEANIKSRLIDGTSGNDTLTGTTNGDLVTGFGGDDILTGGAGNDAFVFRAADPGHDTITDFVAGVGSEDIIDTDAFASFNDVLAAASDDGTDTTITVDAANSVTLSNVLVSQLHQDDFQFV